MDYSEILSKAWQILWRNKILWLFGILAGCSSSGNNGLSSLQDNVNFRFDQGDNVFSPQLQRFFENIPGWAWVLLALLFLILFIIGIILVTVGRIGLARGAWQADEGATHLSFGQLFNESLPYFWRVLLLNILVGIITLAFVFIVIVPLAITVVGLVCAVPLLCLMIPVGWFVTVLVQQSVIAIVNENLGLWEGVRRGWEVITRNLGQYIVMAIILAILGLVASLVIGLPIFAFAVPGIIDLATGTGGIRTGMLATIVLVALYLPILILLNGIIQAYITSAWTLTFRRLTGRRLSPIAVVPAPEPPVEPLSS